MAKRKTLAAKRKTSRQKEKEKDSKQKENLTAKRKRLAAKFLRYREDILILISLPWGRGYSFCREVILFAVRLFFMPWRLILLPWQFWATVPLKFCSRRFLIFQQMWVFVRTSTNFAHLTSFQAIEFMDWPVPKTLDISVCQSSENKAFTFCNYFSPVVRGEDNLIPSLHVFRWERLALWPP